MYDLKTMCILGILHSLRTRLAVRSILIHTTTSPSELKTYACWHRLLPIEQRMLRIRIFMCDIVSFDVSRCQVWSLHWCQIFYFSNHWQRDCFFDGLGKAAPKQTSKSFGDREHIIRLIYIQGGKFVWLNPIIHIDNFIGFFKFILWLLQNRFVSSANNFRINIIRIRVNMLVG